MTHDELMEDLAGHLRTEKRMVWQDLQLGPSGSPRPDVYAIFKSYTAPCPLAYECKVSIADLRSDITSGKWQSYLAYACGVYFAVEASLGVGKNDIPNHCGLIVRREKGWRAAKRAVLNPVTVPQDALLKLLIDGLHRENKPPDRNRNGSGGFNEYLKIQELKSRLGKDVADYLNDAATARASIASAEYSASRIIMDAKQEADRIRKEAGEDVSAPRAELCEILGLPKNADRWALAAAIRDLRAIAGEHPKLKEHRTLTEVIRRALDNYGYKAPEAAVAGEADNG